MFSLKFKHSKRAHIVPFYVTYLTCVGNRSLKPFLSDTRSAQFALHLTRGILQYVSEFYKFIHMIGARGFEPPTPATPLRCATKLRHAPTYSVLYFMI